MYHEYLESHDIEQRPIGFRKFTNFDEPEKSPDPEYLDLQFLTIKNAHETYEKDMSFTFEQLLKSPLLIILLFVTSLFMFSSMSDIYKPYQVQQFIFTQPISYKENSFSRVAFNVLIFILTLILVLIIITIVSLVIGGVGSLNYPQLNYLHIDSSEDIQNYNPILNLGLEIVPAWQIMLKYLGLFASVAFMIIMIFNTIGLVLTNHYVTIGATLALVVVGYVLGTYYIEETWSWLNPFIYLNVWDVVDGWQSVYADNVKINMQNGIIITTSISIILVIVHLLKRQKRVS